MTTTAQPGTDVPAPSHRRSGARPALLDPAGPAALTGRGWAVVLAAVGAGVTADLLLPVPGPAWLAMSVRGLLLLGLPLAALAWQVPGAVRALFGGRPRLRDLTIGLGFAALSMITTSTVATVVSSLTHFTHNPASGILADLGPADRVATFLSMVPQLIGEEVMSVLPFLALVVLLVRVLRAPQWVGVTVATLATAVMFGLVHLPTYGGNVLQCVAVIGISRVVLLVPFLLTRRLWSSVSAHVLNDWGLFGLGLLGH